MILSEIKLNLPVDNAEKTAFLGGTINDDGLFVPQGEQVEFVTYFNAFDAGFFRDHTTVKSVKLRLRYVGRACVVLIRYIPYGKGKNNAMRYTYERVAACVSENESVIDAELKRGGILGFVVKGETNVTVLGGSWECDDACAVNDVRPAFVICTYKREKFAIENAKKLSLVQENAEIIVVDNGNTLTQTDLPEKARLVYGKNLGGSGGFSLGMATAKSLGCTHVILMDDDIVFNPSTPYECVNILRVAVSENITVGSAMLSFARPDVVYEMGAFVGKAKLGLPKHNVDVTQKYGLAYCASKQKTNYSGWWLYAFPVKAIEEFGLSMPYFIKYDDAEFGLRLSAKYDLVFPIGLGVWHQEFETKLPPYLYYYLRRNYLITSAIHSKNFTLNAVVKLLGSVVMFRKDLFSLDYVISGYEDYLKGVEFFANADGEELHEIIKKSPYKKRNLAFSLCKAISLSAKLIFNGKNISDGYKKQSKALVSEESWRKRLLIE